MKNKTRTLKIAAISLLIFVLVSVTALAAFSDYENMQTDARVGTVRIDDIDLQIKDVPVAASGTGDFGDGISNWNPGDANLVKWDVINLGNKSIDTRNTIVLYWDEDPDLPEAGIIYLYPADMDDADILTDIRSGDPQFNIDMGTDDHEIDLGGGVTRYGFVYTFESDSLDGTGSAAETGDSTNVDYITTGDERLATSDHIQFKLVLSPKAPAVYMSKHFAINVITEARQHKNSSDWTEVANQSIGIGGLTIVPSAETTIAP